MKTIAVVRDLRERRYPVATFFCLLKGLNPSSLSKIENARIKAGPVLRDKISRALKTPPSALFHEDGTVRLLEPGADQLLLPGLPNE